MRVIGYIGCLFKGHDVYPSESLVGDVMIDKRNWLCECHRCGLYIAHDGASSGITVPMSRREAYKLKDEFIEVFGKLGVK